MTVKSLSELEGFLSKELPIFKINGPLMLLTPVNQLLRGIYFEKSAYDKTAFSVTFFGMILCVPAEHLSFNFGGRVRHEGGGDRWMLSRPDLVRELTSAIEAQALPYLDSIDSPERFAASISKSSGNPHSPKAMAFALARANKDRSAIEIIDDLLERLDVNIPWHRLIADQVENLKLKLIENPESAHEELESWEAETIRKLGLEQFKTRVA